MEAHGSAKSKFSGTRECMQEPIVPELSHQPALFHPTLAQGQEVGSLSGGLFVDEVNCGDVMYCKQRVCELWRLGGLLREEEAVARASF